MVTGITALIPVAATPWPMQHKEIHTVELARDRHNRSTELWTQQNKIDSETVSEIADLRQAAILMGEQVDMPREQIKLKCDWKVTSYCVTPLKFSNSKYDWETAKMHWTGHPNSSQMIYGLQKEIKETFSERLSDVTGMDVMKSLTDTLASFNPAHHLNKFLVLAIAILLPAIITLSALKYILARLERGFSG